MKRDENGKFQKGFHYSPKTEFKKGQHWRKHKPYWDKEWLEREYITNQRSAQNIADQFECKENNILYFLKKHEIPTRTTKEVREIKHWVLSGEVNGMFGRRGENSPNWKGGHTPERQALYASEKWKKACRVVWSRDEATCLMCGKKSSNDESFHIHHIISFSVKEKRCEITNLVLLCAKCHHWVHSKWNRKKYLIGEGKSPFIDPYIEYQPKKRGKTHPLSYFKTKEITR